jgi:acetoacetate decarboxylase
MAAGTGLGFKPAGIPMAAPSYGRGPYQFRGTRALMLIGPVAAEQARALLPPPLELLDDSIVIWTLMDCPDVTGIGAHNCACPAIPCRYGDVVGRFVPFLFTSTEASLLCFREVHGWAAILGETTIEQEGDRITGRVSRNGATVADVSAAIDGDQLIGAVPKTPTFLYKEIPSIDTESCDVSRLIATTSALENVALRAGSGRIDFPGGKDDPFSTLAPIQVDQVLFGTWDDIYPETARIIHRY